MCREVFTANKLKRHFYNLLYAVENWKTQDIGSILAMFNEKLIEIGNGSDYLLVYN